MRRKLYEMTGPNGLVKVMRDSFANEYVCELWQNGKHYTPADSFTDDAEDARGTAEAMAKGN